MTKVIVMLKKEVEDCSKELCCTVCGFPQAIQCGTCSVCPNCGTTTGCS